MCPICSTSIPALVIQPRPTRTVELWTNNKYGHVRGTSAARRSMTMALAPHAGSKTEVWRCLLPTSQTKGKETCMHLHTQPPPKFVPTCPSTCKLLFWSAVLLKPILNLCRTTCKFRTFMWPTYMSACVFRLHTSGHHLFHSTDLLLTLGHLFNFSGPT